MWLLILIVSGGMGVLTRSIIYVYPLLLLYLVVLIVKHRHTAVARSSTLVWAILVGTFVVLAILRGGLTTADTAIVAKMTIALIIVAAVSARRFELSLTVLVRVIEIIIAFSIITWIVGNSMEASLPVSYINVLGGKHVSLFSLAYFQVNSKFPILRNESIFWEPGVLAVVIILGYVVKTYAIHARGNTWLYVIGIASTMSLGGILIFTPILMHSMLLRKVRGRRKLRRAVNVLTFILVALVILSIMINPDIFDMVTSLFNRSANTNGSVRIRVIDLVYGFSSALERPWIGHGSNFSDFYGSMLAATGISKAFYDGGITNSVTSMLYSYGFLFTALYTILLVRSCRLIFKDCWWLVAMVLVGCLMEEPLNFCVLFLVVVILPRKTSGYGDAPRIEQTKQETIRVDHSAPAAPI